MADIPIEEYYRQLRKHQKSLTVAGEAMIAFGVWTFIKIVMQLILQRDETIGSLITEESEVSAEVQTIIFIVVFVLVVSIAVIVHLIIGLGAYREGQGRKKGWFYLLIDIFMIGLSVFSIVLLIEQGTFLTSISSALFDFSIIIVCTDILYSAVKCKSINRKLKKLQGGAYEQ